MEALGYDTLCVADHLDDRLASFPALAAAAGELRRRRDELGLSYVVVGGGCHGAMAPVVARLAAT